MLDSLLTIVGMGVMPVVETGIIRPINQAKGARNAARTAKQSLNNTRRLDEFGNTNTMNNAAKIHNKAIDRENAKLDREMETQF